MKHLLPHLRLLALLAALPLAAGAQTAERRTSLGLNLSALQYQGDFGSDYWKMERSSYAPGLAINQYLGRGIDLNTQLFFGELSGRRDDKTHFNTTLVNANAGFKFKLNNGWVLKQNAFFQPYLLAGSGWTYASRSGMFDGKRIDLDKGYVDVFGAAGISLRLGGGVSLFVQSGQHLPLNANLDGISETETPRWADRFLQHTAGLTFNLGQAPDADEDGVPDRLDRCPSTTPGVEVNATGCPPDGDGDGVPDYQDQCPTDAGTAELRGCPDQDGDGVGDAEDACSEVPGKVELQGCPDADNDGVPDQEDQCPDTPAGAQVDAQGCPSPTEANNDTDGDGVANDVDRCPSSPGPASNRGCPEIRADVRQRLKEATQFIGFELNRATLLPSSYPTLDSLAQLLRRYPDYTLSIAGHTDSRGAAAYNLRLSRERAAAARDYLLTRGIDAARVALRGYGAQHPLADNATDAGRSRNRRVEFDLFLTGDPNAAEAKYGPEPTAPSPATLKKATPVKKAPAKKIPARKAPARKAPARKALSPSARATKAPTKAARPAGKAKVPTKKPAKAPARPGARPGQR
ncbi:OmpA family protein [Hymenobacter sp. B81]|uniref:OmpA family protein n=1 Tax=Hymenobacter sp. B81 TaxID=3344878 RepID=UPI0037DC0C45